MTWTLPPEGLNALLALLHEAQLALRALLHALGLTALVQGQPEWPFAQRIAGDMLLLDQGHARRVLLSLLGLGAMLGALLLALFWRRARVALCVGVLATALALPWPEAHLLLAPATPTSFHTSTSGFTTAGIARGQQAYQQHCQHCHGADGYGEGPDAARLPMWPPTLNGSLLWKRLEGELFWHVRQGMRARDGRTTMPGAAARLSDTQVWEVLDYVQAQAAGQMLQRDGAWTYPVRVPDAALRCADGRPRSLRGLRGQRLRVALADAGATAPAPDPRLVSVLLPTAPVLADDANGDCVVQGDEAATALALLLGVAPDRLDGYQVIVDRDGWLRARGRPRQAAWSEDDLVCKSGGTLVPPAARATAAGGLEALIRRMDAQPVRLRRGGFPH